MLTVARNILSSNFARDSSLFSKYVYVLFGYTQKPIQPTRIYIKVENMLLKMITRFADSMLGRQSTIEIIFVCDRYAKMIKLMLLRPSYFTFNIVRSIVIDPKLEINVHMTYTMNVKSDNRDVIMINHRLCTFRNTIHKVMTLILQTSNNTTFQLPRPSFDIDVS